MNSRFYVLILSFFAVSMIVPETSIGQGHSSFTDSRNEVEYKTISLNGKVWMAQNLNFTTQSGSWCYDNKSKQCKVYGRLYTWEQAKSSCPGGWILPSLEDWDDLIDHFGGANAAGKELELDGGAGLDVLLGGERNSKGEFNGKGDSGGYWSSSAEEGGGYGKYFVKDFSQAFHHFTLKSDALAVRCIKK